MTRAAASDQPRGAREQGERLLRGAVSGREQLLVEVEERDRIGLGHPVQHGLGADVHASGSARRHRAAVTSTTGSPASASSSSRTRLTPARRFLNRVEWHRRQIGGPHGGATRALEVRESAG